MLYYDSRINNFPRIDAVLGLLGVDSGEASPSSKKLIIGNPEIWLDFCLSFLDEFLKDFAGTFLVFGLWLGVARSPFLEQFYLYRFLYWNSKMVFLKYFRCGFGATGGSAVGFGWSSSVIALDWSRMPQLLVTIPMFSLEVFSLSCF